MENEQNVESQENTENTENESTEEEEVRNPAAVLKDNRRLLAEAKAHREAKEALEAKVASLEGEEGIAKWKQKAINTEIRAALREQGIKDPSRIMKYLSLDGVDFDDKDSLVGFDENLKALKSELPELFNVKKQVSSLDLFEKKKAEEEKDGTQLQVAKLFGNKRR